MSKFVFSMICFHIWHFCFQFELSAYQRISQCHAEEDYEKENNCQVIIDWGNHMGYSYIAF